jgi:hypothetical protein
MLAVFRRQPSALPFVSLASHRSVVSNAAAVSHSRVCPSILSHLCISIDSFTAAHTTVRPPTALLQAPVRNWLFFILKGNVDVVSTAEVVA